MTGYEYICRSLKLGEKSVGVRKTTAHKALGRRSDGKPMAHPVDLLTPTCA